MSTLCQACGFNNPPGMRFCGNCGTRLSEAAPTPVDAGSAISYSQMILDNELIGGIKRWHEGIALHDLDEEVELIKANIPRGNFLKEKHTKRHYKENWQPKILSKDAYETWVLERKTIAEKCQDIAKDLLKSHRPQPLAGSVDEHIENILVSHQPLEINN